MMMGWEGKRYYVGVGGVEVEVVSCAVRYGAVAVFVWRLVVKLSWAFAWLEAWAVSRLLALHKKFVFWSRKEMKWMGMRSLCFVS